MERLVEAVQRRARERAQRFVGRTMEVLVEGTAPHDPGQLRGRTRHNKAVNFDGTASAGELVEVEIELGDLADALGPRAPAQPRRVAPGAVHVLAIFGPTAVGKTGIAIEVAELLRERGEDPVAVSCDSIQVYRGLEVLSGAATAAERERLEHRLLGIASVDEEFSAGRFAKLAHAEIDGLLAEGRRPIVVGGTGLYMRAALSELELRPAGAVRGAGRGRGGPGRTRARGAARRALAGGRVGGAPERPQADRSAHRARAAGDRAPSHRRGLWSEGLRVPTTLVGLTVDREELHRRIDARVDEMVRLGAGRTCSAPTPSAPRAPPGRRSASTSCSPATSRR